MELAGPHPARLCRPRLVAPAARPRLLHDLQDRAQLDEAAEDGSHLFGLHCVHHQPAIHDVVPQRADAVHPQPLLLAGGELVADALGGQFALELREGQQDVQQHPTHRIGGVELLRHRHEGHVVLVEDLHQFGEIEQGPAQAVDLVGDNDIDLPRFDVGDQALQGRPLKCATRESAIVVVVGNWNPALGAAASDAGGAGIALGVD